MGVPRGETKLELIACNNYPLYRGYIIYLELYSFDSRSFENGGAADLVENVQLFISLVASPSPCSQFLAGLHLIDAVKS